MATNLFNRQPIHGIVADLGPENMGTGNGATAKLPQGALVTGVIPVTSTAFNSVTTATLTVTDGTTVFVNAQDIKTAGTETAAVSQKFFPAGGTIQFNLAQTGGDATAGRVTVVVQYVVLGEGCDIYG